MLAWVFLSGGYFKLPMSISRSIREDVESGRCFSKAWLLGQGMPRKTNFMKLTVKPWAGIGSTDLRQLKALGMVTMPQAGNPMR